MLCVICREQEGVFPTDGAGEICSVCNAKLVAKQKEERIALLPQAAINEMARCVA